VPPRGGKIKKVIQKNKTEILALINEINPIIRGWGNYFKISYHSQNTFIKIGHFIWYQMTLWVKRKYSKRLIKRNISKYIVKGKTASNYKWIWGINSRDKDKENKLNVINISEIKPVRHPLLKLKRNPYLLEDREYFEKRLIIKNLAKFRKAIYKKFNNQCSICNESLHNGENVELHHIIPVKDGGKYTLSNIQPLHQICHASITYKPKTTKSTK